MSGGHKVEIAKHKAAMRTGFYSFSGLWGSKKVPLKLQLLIFTAIVLAAGISGLEPFFLLESDIKSLESARMQLLRRLFGREGRGSETQQTFSSAIHTFSTFAIPEVCHPFLQRNARLIS